MKKPTYNEIASNYQFWMEYIDVIGLDTKEQFESLSLQRKIDMLVQCFGVEDSPKYVSFDEQRIE